MKIVELPFKVKVPILACGADMKGAFALAKADRAYLVDGFGELYDPDNLNAYEAAIKSHESKLNIKPSIVVCDLHPAYFSSSFARDHASELGAKICDVQHHEAHIASAITEHCIKTEVVGIAFDGTGYGPDGCIWGGEFFIGRAQSFSRVAHFSYVPMPGGDAAVIEPWRMAVSYLYKAFGVKLAYSDLYCMKTISVKRFKLLRKMIDERMNSPLTSSAGRLFDAVASIVLAKAFAAYEAELPIELEKIADELCNGCYKFDIMYEDEMYLIDMSMTIKGILSDMDKGLRSNIISAKFHNTMAGVITDVAIRLRKKVHIDKVALSGGVFQNMYLKKKALSLLNKNGFDAYTQSAVNTNDYGIPIGQVAIAEARKICA